MMAKASILLVDKLREAAETIERTETYHWGHVGRCNCGYLAQSLVDLDAAEIYKRARDQRLAEWTEFAEEYCPLSGAPMDEVLDAMFQAGLERKDIQELEYLSNKKILTALPGGPRYLQRSNQRDVALYLRTWAGLMELQLKESPAVSKKLLPGLVG